ncbi:MAG: hypothetical protein Q9166_003180 [cf. Caloplaca sp. 2 TL-2023]
MTHEEAAEKPQQCRDESNFIVGLVMSSSCLIRSFRGTPTHPVKKLRSTMCTTKIRCDQPDEEAPVVVPIGPISWSPLPAHPTPRTSPLKSRLQQLQQQPTRTAADSGSQQQIVIAKQPLPSPHTPRPKIQHGSSYYYGSGPVPKAETLARPLSYNGGHHRSYSQQAGAVTASPGRRSGSVTMGL